MIGHAFLSSSGKVVPNVQLWSYSKGKMSDFDGYVLSATIGSKTNEYGFETVLRIASLLLNITYYCSTFHALLISSLVEDDPEILK